MSYRQRVARARLVAGRLGLMSKTVFSDRLEIPALKTAIYREVPFFMEWDPNKTKVTGARLSYAAKADGWSPITGSTFLGIILNDRAVDSHSFPSPGQYSNTVDVSNTFFNGPNLLRLDLGWIAQPVPMPNLTPITCDLRADVVIEYEGLSPTIPPSATDYLPYVAIGIGLGIIYLTVRG